MAHDTKNLVKLLRQGWRGETATDLMREAADLIEARHPTEEMVTTVEELDALPEGTAILDREGDVWQYRGGLWCSYETAPRGSVWTFRKYNPLRVLFRPVPADEEGDRG